MYWRYTVATTRNDWRATDPLATSESLGAFALKKRPRKPGRDTKLATAH